METGTDKIVQSTEIKIAEGDSDSITRAWDLCNKEERNMMQNPFFALVYNAMGVPVAAGILFPFSGILFNPIISTVSMSLSSVSVISNALRL